jgi:hypothetical protein
VGGLGRCVEAGAVSEPYAAQTAGHFLADGRALVFGECAVDVGGDLGADLGGRGCRVGIGFESCEPSCGDDGFGGVPVEFVSWGAGLGVGAEGMGRVIGLYR